MMQKHFSDEIYAQDNPPGDAHGWIQWKGTTACIDLNCRCGNREHYDGDEFAYFYRCSACGVAYAIGQVVKLIPLTAEQVRYVEQHTCGFIDPD